MNLVDRISAAMARLGALQARRPWVPLVACLLVASVAAVFAQRLELRTRFDQLLPDSQPSVIELRRIRERTSSATKIYAVLEGDDSKALRDFGDALLPQLRALGPAYISSATDGVQEARTFLMHRAGLFLKTPELEKLRADVDARWDWEVAKEDGSLLDEGETPPPPLTAAELEKRFRGRRGANENESEYPDGYFQSKDGKALVVYMTTPIAHGDIAHADEALGRVKRVVESARTGRFASIRADYAGDLVTGLAEWGAAKQDLTQVGITGVALVLGVIALFFARVRALAVMGVTIFCGLAWTFGLTALLIGHLNIATGFLFSIIAGNGINAGIIWLQRFYEERRKSVPLAEAVSIAQRETWMPTFVAAVASAAAYFSMIVTDFRAFKDFAVIGASGMLLCWIATSLVLPSLVVLIDPADAPSFTAGNDFFARVRRGGVRFQAPFVFAVERFPRALGVFGIASAVLGGTLAFVYIDKDPMEYDLRRLQNDASASTGMYRVSHLAADILGAELDSSMVVLTDRLEQVPLLKKTLEARRDAAPAGDKPLGAVHTLLDFVPDDQDQKLPTLEALGERMTRAHERGMITEADWKKLGPLVPPEGLAPFGLERLPESLAEAFTEKDGTRGRLVVIEPAVGRSDSDLRYLLLFANAFRETPLPDGSVVRGSGRAVIFADVLSAVQSDMPKATALSLALVLAAVAFTFRRGGYALAVLGSLAVGLAQLAAFLFFGRVKINFFNFVALPITFGIGVDYAVNLMQRYVADGERRRILDAMSTTGGAIVLCSMTTTLGYLALVGSMNQAIRSLGTVAVAGEVACLGSAMLVLAAACRWRETDKGALLTSPRPPGPTPAGSGH